MHRNLTPRTLQRAQWFNDLNDALVEAEKLLAMLDSGSGFPTETEQLRARIQAVQSELALLNRVALGEGRVVGTSWPEPARAVEG